ncbi:HTH-type transcriptional activator RhaS [Frondihabitans sp. 762G35]|uniref:AraC family transcriptional regulator n=1 Tax=Frondihabitans sp. 762G35 TaxID=1446794 RepID=UPI000D21A00A|nr:helix-turn-helix domain-containing protein [Frondihabitans sp. 762G35]ARC58374.1 HTH-type transcriptional activator RhaS [Frondihabitans sp. 762G35]
MTTEPTPLIRSEIAGRDLDQARAMYEDGYNGAGFRAEQSESEFSYRYTVQGDADMSLRSSMFLGEIDGTIQPENEYIVGWLTSGAGSLSADGQDSAIVVGRPFMFPSGKPFSFELVDYRQNLIHFSAPYLESVAAEHEGLLAGPLDFAHAVVPEVEALRRWRSTVTMVARTVIGQEPTPLLLSEAKRLAATTLLDTFAHGGTPIPPAVLLPRNGRLRVAVEYIHAHAHLPISSGTVAEAAGLSVRGLQSAFASQLDTTPNAYLRDVRLDHVHADLLALESREATVTDVAARWGFAHLGRFAAAYAARFGERPAETLRR